LCVAIDRLGSDDRGSTLGKAATALVLLDWPERSLARVAADRRRWRGYARACLHRRDIAALCVFVAACAALLPVLTDGARVRRALADIAAQSSPSYSSRTSLIALFDDRVNSASMRCGQPPSQSSAASSRILRHSGDWATAWPLLPERSSMCFRPKPWLVGGLFAIHDGRPASSVVVVSPRPGSG